MVEILAHSLFDPHAGPLRHIGLEEDQRIEVPRLLNHCLESGVLVTEDPGPLVTLWDILTPSSFQDLVVSQLNTLRLIGGDIGSKLGSFFAELHSAHTRELIECHESDIVPELKSAYVPVLETKVLPVLARLKKYGTDISSETAQELFRRVLRAHSSYRGSSFSHGNCHPGAILVQNWPGLLDSVRSKPLAESTDEHMYMAIIDWKFAQLKGRGVDGDMAQLLASLHCQQIYLNAFNPGGARPDARVQEALLVTQAVVWGICQSYSSAVQFDPNVHESSRTADLLRSTLIQHGREMINQAVERDWFIPAGSDIKKTDLIKKMVSIGIKYLQKGGKHRSSMVRDWSKDPIDEDAFITTLFGL